MKHPMVQRVIVESTYVVTYLGVFTASCEDNLFAVRKTSYGTWKRQIHTVSAHGAQWPVDSPKKIYVLVPMIP